MIVLKKANRWLIGLLITVPALAGAVSLWMTLENERSPSSPAEVAPPQKVTALGRLEPQSEVIHLFAPLALDGDRVAQLLVKQGDWVEANQVVAILESRARLQAEFAEAQKAVRVAQAKLAQVKAGAKTGEIEAQRAAISRLEAEQRTEIEAQRANISRLATQLANAEIEHQRHHTLYQQGAISASLRDSKRTEYLTSEQQLAEAQATLKRIQTAKQQELNQARATLDHIAEVRPVDVEVAQTEIEQAIAAAERAETELAQASVRSPVAGQVLKIEAYPGETIGDNGIVQLGQTDQMQAIAEVYQTDIHKVRPGQRATVTGNGLADTLHGTVNEIGLQIERQKVFSNEPGENLDRRVVEVEIHLTPEDSQRVAGLTNLQVQAAIWLEEERQATHLP
ncbi:MAG: ABC exporter membrane fusion protein [Cyanophyceae cyanobacterium]